MSLINEQNLENYCMEYFRQIGYQTLNGLDILPDGPNPLRQDIRQAILPPKLKEALARLNPQVPPNLLEDAYQLLANPQEPSLLARNKTIYTYLTENIKLPYTDKQGEDKTAEIKIIDFDNTDNNDFLAVNQFTLQGSKNVRLPDIAVFINGLPL